MRGEIIAVGTLMLFCAPAFGAVLPSSAPKVQSWYCSSTNVPTTLPQMLQYDVNGTRMEEISGDKLMEKWGLGDRHFGWEYVVILNDRNSLVAVGAESAKSGYGSRSPTSSLVMIDKVTLQYIEITTDMANLYNGKSGQTIEANYGSCEER